MIREILFRGFHEEENGSTTIHVDGRTVKGEWIYGYYIEFRMNEDRPLLHYIQPTKEYDRLGFVQEIIPSTVGEYTGLYGEDEKRIFEGDKCIVTLFDREGSDSQYSCKVDYYEGCFFAGNDTDFCVPLQEIGDTQADVTVTGTIFDTEVAK